ncbi:hypothetical protein Tco_1409584 [Tanacetum coccineum]
MWFVIFAGRLDMEVLFINWAGARRQDDVGEGEGTLRVIKIGAGEQFMGPRDFGDILLTISAKIRCRKATKGIDPQRKEDGALDGNHWTCLQKERVGHLFESEKKSACIMLSWLLVESLERRWLLKGSLGELEVVVMVDGGCEASMMSKEMWKCNVVREMEEAEVKFGCHHEGVMEGCPTLVSQELPSGSE